jgi:hypothetical protein
MTPPALRTQSEALATLKMQPGQKCGTGTKKSLPILIRVLDQVKLRIRSTPSQFPLAQDALETHFRPFERNLVLSHLVDGPALATKLFHISNMHLATEISSSLGISRLIAAPSQATC